MKKKGKNKEMKSKKKAYMPLLLALLYVLFVDKIYKMLRFKDLDLKMHFFYFFFLLFINF